MNYIPSFTGLPTCLAAHVQFFTDEQQNCGIGRQVYNTGGVVAHDSGFTIFYSTVS